MDAAANVGKAFDCAFRLAGIESSAIPSMPILTDLNAPSSMFVSKSKGFHFDFHSSLKDIANLILVGNESCVALPSISSLRRFSN
jgi:hypothetical protein